MKYWYKFRHWFQQERRYTGIPLMIFMYLVLPLIGLGAVGVIVLAFVAENKPYSCESWAYADNVSPEVCGTEPDKMLHDEEYDKLYYDWYHEQEDSK